VILKNLLTHWTTILFNAKTGILSTKTKETGTPQLRRLSNQQVSSGKYLFHTTNIFTIG